MRGEGSCTAPSLSPLSLATGQVSFGSQIPLADHDALTLGLHWGTSFVAYDDLTQLNRRAGADLGWRHVFGHDFSGLFIGASALVDRIGKLGNQGYGDLSGVTYGGGAVDVGGQLVHKSGFVVTGGVGVQYVAALFSDGGQSAYTFPVPVSVTGVTPRLLFTLGYAF